MKMKTTKLPGMGRGGGIKENGEITSEVLCFDPRMEEWGALKSMIKPRAEFAVVTIGHILYAIG